MVPGACATGRLSSWRMCSSDIAGERGAACAGGRDEA